MGTLCILGVDDNRVLKDFVRAHVELLSGPTVCLDHSYPDYRHDGKTIRFFYSARPVFGKLLKLVPQGLYSRIMKQDEHESLQEGLEGFVARHGVDVILAEFGPAGALIAPHAQQLGIPLVVHFHGHDAHRRSVVEKYSARYRSMFDYAFRIVSVSHFMTETLVGLGAERSRIIYNPYGPRDAFFDVTPSYRPTVLSVGRFTDIKANYLTLAAFRKSLESCPDAKLVMVGDGELLETCKTLSRVWGIDSSVTFAGAVPHALVAERYSEVCCFALHSCSPSYGDAEGTPVAVLEAGAASLPVVATRHAGIPDVIEEGVTGFLVEEEDVEGMAAHMAALLSDPGLCRTMGSAAKARVRNSFSMGRHIAILQETIDAARASRRTT